jgi:hypothetical protein
MPLINLLLGWIPAWAANQATKTFAPKIIENLSNIGPKYQEWKSKNDPDKKIWLSNEPYHWEKKKSGKDEKDEKDEKDRDKKSKSKKDKKSDNEKK